MQSRPQLSSFNNFNNMNLNLYGLQNRMQNRVKQAGQFVNNATGSISNAFKAFTNPNSNFMPAPPLNRFASSGNRGSTGVVDDGQFKMFTRDDLNKLYGNQQKKNTFMNTNFFSLGNGPIEHIIMMFQLYVALVAALARLSMNTASMGASFLFGNETLINLFSIFLENALNLILNRNVGEMTFEQLQHSLEENRPKLQKMSALLIKEMTDLALGLSAVCSRIAMDWVTNVLPGLLKSSAIAASSAAEAGLNAATMGAFGEIVEIFSAGAATIAGILKVMKGLQSNAENFSEAYRKVSNAYDGVMKLTELFSKSPSEIAADAESAIPAAVKKIADAGVDATFQRNPFLSATPSFAVSKPPAPTAALAPATALPTTEETPVLPPLSNFNLRNLGKGVANAVANAGIQRLKTFGNSAKNTFSNFLKSPNGTPLKDSNGTPIETSWWKSKWKSLFDTAVNKIKNTGKYGKFNATVVEYVIRHPDVLIPFLPVPYNIAAIAFRLVQTYLRYVHQQNPTAPVSPANTVGVVGGGGGGGGNRKNKKSLKYKQKHLKKYMSNLRRKTAKKELQLLNGIRDLKSISS